MMSHQNEGYESNVISPTKKAQPVQLSWALVAVVLSRFKLVFS